MSLFDELKRRNVFRVAAAYAVLCWLVLQVTDVLLDALELPAEHAKIIVLLLVIGAIPALVFSWVYEITPDGLKKESEIRPEESITAHTAAKLDKAVIALLVLAIALFAFDRFLVGDGPVPVAEEPAVAASLPTEGPMVAARPQPMDASVAVLPFTTRSSAADDVYFSDGVHDDLLTQLAKIGELRVISRTSVMEYRDTTKNMRQIGQELGVATIVEGAVQRSGSMVRITAQLIDTETDEHLWAETYDRELTATNLFQIQTEIATAIAGALQASLSEEEQAELNRQLTEDLQALEAYQRARLRLTSFDLDQIELALSDLDFALSRDPGFAAAFALRARFHMARYWQFSADPAYRDAAWADIERARAIEPDLPELHIAEGTYHYWGFRDYARALEALEPAIDAYPNDADLLVVTAWVNRRYGRFDTAIELLRRAMVLAPRDPEPIITLGETLLSLGRYEEIPSLFQRVDRLDPNNARLMVSRGSLALQRDDDLDDYVRYVQLALPSVSFSVPLAWQAHLLAGDYEGALAIAERYPDSIVTDTVETAAMRRALALFHAGESSATEALATARDELEAMLEGSTAVGAHELALCQVTGAQGDIEAARRYCEAGLSDILADAYNHDQFYVPRAAAGLAMAGDLDGAFELLEAAIDRPVGPRRNALKNDPAYRNLHDDPRWGALLAEAPL